MSLEAMYIDPWRRSDDISATYTEFYAALHGDLPHGYDAEDEFDKSNMAAKGLLLGITVMAPFFIRPTKAEAGDLPQNTATKVVVIGDSLTVGRERAGLTNTLDASGFEPLVVSSYGGRPLVLPGCDTKPVKQACFKFSDGVREVEKAAQQVDDADIVMLSLGTNDQANLLQERLYRTIDKIVEVGSKQDGKPPIIVVPEIFGESSRISSAAKDEIIHAVAADYNGRGIKVIVPAYKEFIDSTVRPAGNMSSDEIHLNGTGYKQLVMYDVSQLLDIQNTLKPAVPPVEHDPADPLPQSPTYQQPNKTQPNSQNTGGTSFAVLPRNIPMLPSVASYVPPRVQNTARFDLNMVPLQSVESAKIAMATSFAEPSITVPTPVFYTDTTVQLPQERLEQLGTETLDMPQEMAPVVQNQESLQQKAEKAGIFYDPASGRAMTRFKSFFNPDEIAIPEMRHGFREPRDLPDTDFYLHSNTDWHAPAGTTFVSPVPAVVIRYDDQYPGQKKGVGNSLVLVMGNDQTGKPIVIQGTHFSEIFVKTGDIVMPGQPLAKAGETGIAYGAHFSVGISDDSLEPYTNLANSLNPVDYFDFDYTCAPSAIDDNGELCASDGSPIALPVDVSVLASLGLPEYSTDVVPPLATTSVPQPHTVANDFATALPTDITELPLVNDNTSVYIPPATSPTAVEEPANDVAQVLVDQPPTFIQDIPPAEEPTQPTQLPNVEDITDPLDSNSSNSNEPPKEAEEPATAPPVDSEPNVPVIPPQDQTTEPAQPNNQPESPVPTETIGANTSLTIDDVATVLPNANIETIRLYTPLLIAALEEQSIADNQMICYTLATIHVETSGMLPIAEYGKGNGHDYGIADPVTGQTYYGRGFIQLTGKGNYETYGNALGVDLVNNPDLALDPTISARILALYMKYHEGGIRENLNAGDLKGARQIVNGRAAHGLAGFSDRYNACQTIVGQKG